jgi:hypothetical protein
VLSLMASFLLLMPVFLLVRLLVLAAPVDILATSLAVTHRLSHVGGKRLASDPLAPISSFLMELLYQLGLLLVVRLLLLGMLQLSLRVLE